MLTYDDGGSREYLIEEADECRNECWKMIKERQDCTFLFLTKRIDRFMKCILNDLQPAIIRENRYRKIP